MKQPLPVPQLAGTLLSWYQQHRRHLPWREKPDPYAVWVSEIMLQQTQVSKVLPYFERFLDAYPGIQQLAAASEEDVLSLWSGLGYYARARNLWRAARQICDRHSGVFPADYSAVLQLPGIGRYTAGAILSIAFGQPFPILDGNIRRFLSRYLCIETAIDSAQNQRLWKLLEEMVSDPTVAPHVSHFNQALMELGALVCRPSEPDCQRCPLASQCGARNAKLQDALPLKKTHRAVQDFHFLSAVLGRQDRFLMVQNHDGPFLQGFWEFPRIEFRSERSEQRAGFRRQHQLNFNLRQVLPPVTHRITFRRIYFHPVLVSLEESPAPGCRWVRPGQRGYPVSSYIEKVVSQVRRQAGEKT